LCIATLQALKEGGYELDELRDAFQVVELRTKDSDGSELFTLAELATKFSVTELKSGNCTAQELKEVLPVEEITEAFSAAELRVARFTVGELVSVFRANELFSAGYNIKDLKPVRDPCTPTARATYSRCPPPRYIVLATDPTHQAIHAGVHVAFAAG
jgi:hypothetical protein